MANCDDPTLDRLPMRWIWIWLRLRLTISITITTSIIASKLLKECMTSLDLHETVCKIINYIPCMSWNASDIYGCFTCVCKSERSINRNSCFDRAIRRLGNIWLCKINCFSIHNQQVTRVMLEWSTIIVIRFRTIHIASMSLR
jgi:hypothetical protein